jgi:hypothetical protein
MFKLFFLFASSGQLLKLIGGSSEVSILFSVFSSKHNQLLKTQVISCILLALLLTFAALSSNLVGQDFKISSFLVCFITLVCLSLTNLTRLYSSKEFISNLAAYSVVVSILISLTETYYGPVIGSRTNQVLLLNRLTFLFDEPSHYAIFLAIILHFTDLKRQLLIRSTIAIGLLLTWSLSGFLLYVMLLFYSRIIRFDIAALKVVFYLFVFLVLLSVVWELYLINTDFWIVSKIETVQMLLDGDTRLTSVLVRFTSMFMYVSYISEAVANNDFLSLIFGEGYGNLNTWVNSFYSEKFKIETMTEVNNFVSSIIIQNGIFGLSLFLLAFCSCFSSDRVYSPNIMHFIIILFIIALFNGSAYGSLAILYFYLAIVLAVHLKLKS